MAQAPQKDSFGVGAQPKADGGAPKGPPKYRLFRNRTVTITLGLPKALFSVFFLLFLLVWAFIFGVMLGRGHNPEEMVPELAKVMPAPPPQAESPPDESMNNVLRPQELQYHDSLKGGDSGSPPRITPAPVQRHDQAAKPESAPKSAPQATAPQPTPQKAPTPQDAQDQTVYSYIYQVAASTNQASAENLRKKLEANGFSASISQNKSNDVTWYRILVSFKGKPDDTRILRSKLAQHGISTVILRGKTPVK